MHLQRSITPGYADDSSVISNDANYTGHMTVNRWTITSSDETTGSSVEMRMWRMWRRANAVFTPMSASSLAVRQQLTCACMMGLRKSNFVFKLSIMSSGHT